MRLLAMDMARLCGMAFGEAGDVPPAEVRTVVIGKPDTSQEDRDGNFGCFLRDTFIRARPDMIVVEEMMPVGAQPSADVTLTQVSMHAIVNAYAKDYGIPIRRLSVTDIRKHFCGQATADPPMRGRRRSQREAREARARTKRMVASFCALWGYGEFFRPTEWDKSDACALFHVAAERFCGVKRTHTVAFGKLIPLARAA